MPEENCHAHNSASCIRETSLSAVPCSGGLLSRPSGSRDRGASRPCLFGLSLVLTVAVTSAVDCRECFPLFGFRPPSPWRLIVSRFAPIRWGAQDLPGPLPGARLTGLASRKQRAHEKLCSNLFPFTSLGRRGVRVFNLGAMARKSHFKQKVSLFPGVFRTHYMCMRPCCQATPGVKKKSWKPISIKGPVPQPPKGEEVIDLTNVRLLQNTGWGHAFGPSHPDCRMKKT